MPRPDQPLRSTSAPRPPGPQPRDGLQRALQSIGAPRPAGSQPRDGLQRAVRDGWTDRAAGILPAPAAFDRMTLVRRFAAPTGKADNLCGNFPYRARRMTARAERGDRTRWLR